MATSTKSELIGVVLAGGRSQRMGRDKSLIEYHGMPQREYTWKLLQVFCDKVYLSCRDGSDIPDELNPLVDELDFESPLNGILTVFQKHPLSALLCLAVDMPFVDNALIKDLLSRRDQTCLATCYKGEDGKPEPLCTLWESSSLGRLQQFVRDGNISPRAFLETNRVRLLDAADPTQLQSINTPADLARRQGR